MKNDDLIKKIIETIPNCSRITENDQNLYNEFFKTERKKYPYHYTRSWIFIKQISQGLGIRYFDKKKEHLITIAPNWGGSVPNYVYLPLGVNAVESVPFLIKQLSKVLGGKITVKKVYGEENRNFLLKNGAKEQSSDHGLSDDRYPEIVCDVDSIIKAALGFPTEIKMDSFKEHIRKIRRKISVIDYEVQEKKLSRKLEEEFKNLIDKWSSDIAERTVKQLGGKSEVRELKKWMGQVYYPYFIKELIENVEGEELIAYLTFIDGKPVGFTSAYPVSDSCLAVNGALSDTKYRGLIQYLFFSLAIKAKNLGYRYLNLGSSDNEQQHQYKSSMGKIYEAQLYILEFDPKV